ncbi:hypothetical protein ACWEKT_19345 [Nocardia takedensis]
MAGRLVGGTRLACRRIGGRLRCGGGLLAGRLLPAGRLPAGRLPAVRLPAGRLAAVLAALLIGSRRLGRLVWGGLWTVRWLRCGLLLAAGSRWLWGARLRRRRLLTRGLLGAGLLGAVLGLLTTRL